MKKTILISLLFGLSVTTFNGYAGDADKAAVVAANRAIGSATNALSGSNLPEWLKRTDIDIGIQENLRESFTIETIQPLFMDDVNTAFFQGRLTHDGHEEDETINLGLGYRYLTPNKTWLLGVNGWYDHTFDLNHKRVGLGLEAIGEYLTFRSNYYDAVSGWKTVSLVDGVTTEEKALDGYDIELETPVPYLPWARLSGKAYKWEAINVDDVEGFTVALRMNPTGNTELTLGVTEDDTKNEVFLNLTWYFGRPAGTEYTAANGISSQVAVKRDLTKHRLDKVRRHHNVVVERKTSGGSGLSVVRGT
ncbi:MAG: inverse autotransporter beta domain-containing protein [Rhodospirillales bacterium]|jgi:hypothetical protein